MHASAPLRIPSWFLALFLAAYLGALWASFLLDTGWNGLVYFTLAPVYGFAIVVTFVAMFLWRNKPLVVGWMPLFLIVLVGLFTVATTYRGCGDADRCEALLPVFPDPIVSIHAVYVHGILPVVAVAALLLFLQKAAKRT